MKGVWFPTNGYMSIFSQNPTELSSIIYKKPFLIKPGDDENALLSTNRYLGNPILHFIGRILLPFAREDIKDEDGNIIYNKYKEFERIKTYENGENMIGLFNEFFDKHAADVHKHLYPNYTGPPRPNTRDALPENSPVCDMLTINMWSGKDVIWENPKGKSMDPRNSPGYFEVTDTKHLVPIENALKGKEPPHQPFGRLLIRKPVFIKTHEELVKIGEELMGISKQFKPVGVPMHLDGDDGGYGDGGPARKRIKSPGDGGGAEKNNNDTGDADDGAVVADNTNSAEQSASTNTTRRRKSSRKKSKPVRYGFNK